MTFLPQVSTLRKDVAETYGFYCLWYKIKIFAWVSELHKYIITKQNKIKREAGRKKPINTTRKLDSQLNLCLSDIKSDKNQENQGQLH